ncbi:TetR/AcrR family transcriptional regulator [Streptomyces sp. NPDC059819]|uniref:TetR/AcrR family transcriptional regulator n=1 Tax=Streptomyces sp. NPDC059819 TaxID=3346963 RepID=UPI003657A2EB
MDNQAPALRRARLTAERVGEVYVHVMDLLCEVGYDSLTMDAIAARARTSKATLYRLWKDKPELVATALRQIGPIATTDCDTGSLRGDLLALTCSPRPEVERQAAIQRALAHAAFTNPDLDRALRQLVFEPRLEAFEAALRRASARGEIDPDAPAAPFLRHMIVGAAMARIQVDRQVPDSAFMTSYIDTVVLPALASA